MKPLSAIILCTALLAGCTTLPRDVRKDGWARLGEATHVGPLIVRPDQVDEDSRCAEGTRCVWAGMLKIEVSMWRGGKASAAPVTLGKPHRVAGGTLLLDEARPVKQADKRIRPEEYVFHFRWTAD
ncbi:MAG: hypothetical protein KGL48_16355 [Sphingomonadales bacterium]|nr:hypothetical protein [Sphingomonadales bacterium]MDE2568043.1 hypothetical protein [Sphingomonadales bacterium]